MSAAPRRQGGRRAEDGANLDLSADLPHQQNENARRCRGCYRTLTTRCHAVCAECVDPATGFGCCSTCIPALVSA